MHFWLKSQNMGVAELYLGQMIHPHGENLKIAT